MVETELAKQESGEIEPLVNVAPAMIPARPWMSRIEEHTSWPTLSRLRVPMRAGVALSGFKVGDLLRLEPGQVIESIWPETEDVPLVVGKVQVAWGEFEVVEQHLVVRLTRLA